MTVKELIEKLKMHSPELLVVTRGMDETDFADLETVELVKVKEHRTSVADYKKSNEENASLALLIDHS